VVVAAKDAGKAEERDAGTAARDAGTVVAAVDAGAKAPAPDVSIAKEDAAPTVDAAVAAAQDVAAPADAAVAAVADAAVATVQDTKAAADTTAVAQADTIAPDDASVATAVDAPVAAPDVVHSAAADVGAKPEPVDAGTAQAAADATPGTADAAVASVPSGTVRVTATPSMEVYWEGKRQGTTPLTLTLPVGKHSLSLRGPEGLRKSATANVKADEKTNISVSAEKGMISFDAPTGVAVYMNGKPLGKMPAVGRREVWEGTYDITFEHPDGRRIKKKIQINRSSPKVLVSHRF
jgi:serine/threonine-protein kinase